MKAIGYTKFGTAVDVLEMHDLPTPDPAPGEVLVELALSGVNPSDVKARGGTRPGVTTPPFPLIIPHSDGAGRIVAVGNGVDAARIDEQVWIWNGQWRRAFGTCASHIALPAAQAVPLPESVSMETGAQLGIPGLTAAYAVFAAGDVRGRKVLVSGAGGTVGYLAVQLAVWAGAEVIATARGADMDRARAAGATHVVDFSAPDQAARILEAAGGPLQHIVEVEFGRNIATNAEVIAENGSICAYGSALDMAPTVPFGPLLFKAVSVQIALIYILQDAPRAAAINRLHQALSDGALTCPVAETLPLDKAASAHERVETGTRSGAMLIRCN